MVMLGSVASVSDIKRSSRRGGQTQAVAESTRYRMMLAPHMVGAWSSRSSAVTADKVVAFSWVS